MNIVKEKRHLKRIFKKALKIGVGSGLAIAAAHFMGLKNEIFAGTITLLTVLTTKWETIKLTMYRAVTFVFSVLVCWLVFNHLGGGWAEYGVFLIVMILFCECMGWGATISVNAVIGAHFFTEADFSIVLCNIGKQCLQICFHIANHKAFYIYLFIGILWCFL